MSITIYGASDDLIEVEGDIREEFYALDTDDGFVVALSEGTLIDVRYSGIWRFHVLVTGEGSTVSLVQAPADDEDNYSDRLTVEGDVRWVAVGKDYAVLKKAVPDVSGDA